VSTYFLAMLLTSWAAAGERARLNQSDDGASGNRL